MKCTPLPWFSPDHVASSSAATCVWQFLGQTRPQAPQPMQRPASSTTMIMRLSLPSKSSPRHRRGEDFTRIINAVKMHDIARADLETTAAADADLLSMEVRYGGIQMEPSRVVNVRIILNSSLKRVLSWQHPTRHKRLGFSRRLPVCRPTCPADPRRGPAMPSWQ